MDFAVGDYVLYSKAGIAREATTVDKTRTVWSGPALVTGTDGDAERVYTVKDIGSGQSYTVHAQYAKRFAGGDLVVTPQLIEWAAHIGRGFIVAAIVDHEQREGTWYFRVHWEGYTLEESTWESVKTLGQDVPVLLRRYSKTIRDTAERKQVLDAIEKASKSKPSKSRRN